MPSQHDEALNTAGCELSYEYNPVVGGPAVGKTRLEGLVSRQGRSHSDTDLNPVHDMKWQFKLNQLPTQPW